ncbi:hypothetical protein [Trichocoleus sp. FACHB-46]|uniref:Lipoprotein n=2 Tax=Trichocoleus TaxID=450526 RepID=A0ABV0J6U7_9CYAN|nr:hypothetical protein [Trichocoleus sp. FACHB-46]MBD1863696.1 hypothetical protein [Trichocoleus sp. FACHB-46]
MRGIGLVFVRFAVAIAILVLLRLGCSRQQTTELTPKKIQLAQTWELQPGSAIAGYSVTGGLGDISIALSGKTVFAPFTGLTQPYQGSCVLFSSDEVPAYLFRLCGLKQPRLGEVRQGQPLGNGDYLQFAALRKQPNGTWAFVEPSRNILERTLKQP